MECNNPSCACWRHPAFDHAAYALELEYAKSFPTDMLKRLSAARYPTLPPLRGNRNQVVETFATRLTLYPRRQ